MEGDEKMLKEQSSETGQNSADFFVNDQNDQSEGQFLEGKKPRMKTREKVNTFLIVIVAVFAVFLGYYQLSYNISHPFTFAEAPNQIDPNIDCPGGNCDLKSQLAALVAEQNKDTDKDGLPDYQEINIYHTSPFLEDTDGDGFSDGQEVKQGFDPNCPQGQNCLNADTGNASTGTVPTLDLLPTAGGVQITPDFIRETLLQGGFSQEYLDQFTDADLIAVYQEVIKSEPSMAQTATDLGLDLNSAPAAAATGTIRISTSSLSSTTVNLNINSIDDLKNLTGAQIRQLMLQSGPPESVLSQVTDDQLKTIFLEKLSEKSSTTVSQ